MIDPIYFVTFVAGFVSFFAPCVFPLVPGFLAYLGGVSLDQGNQKNEAVPTQMATLKASIFFVLGFMTVFSVLGLVLHGVLLETSFSVKVTLAKVGGAIVIFFGLYLMGLFKLLSHNFFSFFDRPHTISVFRKFSSRATTSFVFGAAFALGWTPCVGAVLGGIFGLAVLMPTKAFFLLLVYALGLGVPFIIVGLFAGKLQRYFAKDFGWITYLNILFGGILVFVGSLAFTQNLAICREILWNFPF